MPSSLISHRLTGHESFVCRFAWLPKAVNELERASDGPELFRDENEAMVRLGVGKNMVRSIKFWAEAAGIIEQLEEGKHFVSAFGKQLLGEEGHDPYLERPQTLWILHWKIATKKPAFFFWDQMLNYWHRSEFTASEALAFLLKETGRWERPPSERTVADGLRVFVNTYVPTRGRKGEIAEDNLDCPLVELNLIKRAGDRKAEQGDSREPIYQFRVEEKPEISPALFAYALNEYWNSKHSSGETLSFRFASSAPGSPGQIFKLPELGVRNRLDALNADSESGFSFVESASLQEIHRRSGLEEFDLLHQVYSN